MKEKKRIHVFITGDVTGVGFRSWTKRQADRLHLTGWVRNADRKVVETIAEGNTEDIETFLNSCRKGPDSAWVQDVEVTWEKPEGIWTDFSVRL